MKKVLLSCSAFLCLLVANSQLYLNEFYVRPNPSSSHQEFFELFNAATVPENAGCYTLVTYFRQSPSTSGLYVIDIPDIEVPARGHLLASSQAPTFYYQEGPATAHFSWNKVHNRCSRCSLHFPRKRESLSRSLFLLACRPGDAPRA